MALGDRLKEIRQSKRLTIREAGVTTGVNYSMIALIETGKKDPQFSTVKRLLEGYGYELRILPKLP